MKLSRILEGIWHTYGPSPAGTDTSRFTYYIDMDGVLVDLEGGIKSAGSKKSWRSPDALKAAIGDFKDPEATRKFYLSLRPTRGARQIWQAAASAGNKPPYILTACPPDIAGLADAKFEWALENLNPTPTDVLPVEYRQKNRFSKEQRVLVDDSADEIRDWQSAGGVGIWHYPSNLESTIAGINSPAGELGMDLDLKKNRGLSTTPPEFKAGKYKDKTAYLFGQVERRMHIRHIQIPLGGARKYELEVFGMFQVDDSATKELIKLFKAQGASHPELQKFLAVSARAISKIPRLTAGNDHHRPIDIICMPQSSKILTRTLAMNLAKLLGAPEPVMWSKNSDPESIQIKQDGVLAYCMKTGEDPQKVYSHWKRQAAQWSAGTRDSKELNQYLRRDNNMSNMYVRPSGLELRGKSVLIVDDATSFFTTMSDMTLSCLKAGAANVIGTVLWMMV